METVAPNPNDKEAKNESQCEKRIDPFSKCFGCFEFLSSDLHIRFSKLMYELFSMVSVFILTS